MKVFLLNWLLVFGAVCWFISSVVLLVGYNKTTTFDENYYPGACIVRAVFYSNLNETAIAYLDYQDPPKNFELKENVTILNNYNPLDSHKYMNLYYPIGSHVGCLVSQNGLSIQIQDDGSFFIAALMLYIVCAISLCIYAVLQYWIYRKRLIYKELDDEDPQNIGLYQNTTTPAPGVELIKEDFAYAQKMLWMNQSRINYDRFQELVDLQLKAIVTLNQGTEKTKFMLAVHKTVDKI